MAKTRYLNVSAFASQSGTTDVTVTIERPLTAYVSSNLYFYKEDVIISPTTGLILKCTSNGYVSFRYLDDLKKYYGTYRYPLALFKKDGYKAIRKPSAAKKMAAPTRGSDYKIDVKWQEAKINNDSASRPTSIYFSWLVNTKTGSTANTITSNPGLAVSASSATLDLNSFSNDKNVAYTRKSFYPVTNTKVTSVAAQIQYKNDGAISDKVKTSMAFKIPRKPTIGDWVFNANNGEVTFHIKTNAGTDIYERYDTQYHVYVKSEDGSWHLWWNTTDTSTDIAKTIDLTNYSGLTYSQYYQIRVRARSRGFAGDSDWTEANYYVGYPALATIKSFAVSGKDLESRLTVRLKTNSTAQHFVEQIKLEYLADVEYANASDIPGSAEWKDAGIVDDAQCLALSVSVQDLIPSAGKYTWFRLKTWCRNENVLYRYTAPQRLKALETPAPTAADERISILKQVTLSEADNDGQTVALTLGWNQNGKDDATGTELTWSTNKNAWRSVKDPTKYEFDWSDGKLTYNKVTYQDSATVYFYDLEEGVPVYFKARRYMEDKDDNVTYSPYSNTFTATPHRKPDPVNVNVSVVGDSTIPSNKSYPISWQHDSDLPQNAWQIINSRTGAVINSASNARQAYQVAASRLASFAVNGVVSYYVNVKLGTAWYKSATRSVTIIPVPTISIGAISTLTVQPLSISVTASQVGTVRVIVRSRGVAGERPDGIYRQAEGDVIYSANRSVSWTTSGNSRNATITLPSRLDFIQNGTYEVECTLINSYNISSAKARRTFSVNWSHQAPDVTNMATITAIDTVDDEGFHRQAASIKLASPTGAASTDRYDVYRLTGDGATLISEGVGRTATVVDEYAPFGDTPTYYRIALRTVDGDVEFADTYYHLEGSALRFDWEDEYVELPYNISISDSYEKDSIVRKHLDGTQDGYWNNSVSRKASLGAVLITLTQQDDIEKMRQLARYAGPVFVRTPDGSAYTADVQVDDLTPTSNVYVSFSISATELDVTESFMAG